MLKTYLADPGCFLVTTLAAAALLALVGIVVAMTIKTGCRQALLLGGERVAPKASQVSVRATQPEGSVRVVPETGFLPLFGHVAFGTVVACSAFVDIVQRMA